MAKKIGVVLSGCGVSDGSEIHESVLALLAIDRAGAQAVCMAPHKPQAAVHNHLTDKDETGQTRDCLAESARIARGKIRDIKEIKARDIDGLIFPGGFGAARNLSTFATQGGDCTVDSEVSRLIKDVRAAGKPMGFICIAPAIAARVLGPEHKVQLTIGTDPSTAKALEGMGARHVNCNVGDIALDATNKIVSTPAYMLAQRISEAATGIEKLVAKVIELA